MGSTWVIYGIFDDGCVSDRTPRAGTFGLPMRGSITVEVNELGGHVFDAEVPDTNEDTATWLIEQFAGEGVYTTFMVVEERDW